MYCSLTLLKLHSNDYPKNFLTDGHTCASQQMDMCNFDVIEEEKKNSHIYMCNFDVVEELKEEQIIMDHKKIN